MKAIYNKQTIDVAKEIKIFVYIDGNLHDTTIVKEWYAIAYEEGLTTSHRDMKKVDQIGLPGMAGKIVEYFSLQLDSMGAPKWLTEFVRMQACILMNVSAILSKRYGIIPAAITPEEYTAWLSEVLDKSSFDAYGPQPSHYV